MDDGLGSRGDSDDLAELAASFDRPWNPYRLIWITFFAGSLAGGILLGRNAVRLGLPDGRRVFGILLGYAVLGVAIAVGIGFVLMKNFEERRMERLAALIIEEAGKEPHDPAETQRILAEADRILAGDSVAPSTDGGVDAKRSKPSIAERALARARESRSPRIDPSVKFWIRNGLAFAGAVLAGFLARPQFARYELAEEYGVKPGPLLGPALAAAAISIVFEFGVLSVLIVFLR
ncbi:MAG: hypothetical protein KDC38_07515 [Planctomycetes bacterium]|nr:hypothetical protein [Planctomycetota bacterium]